MPSPYYTDMVAMFSGVSAQIVATRAALGLNPLKVPAVIVPNQGGLVGALMIGQEWVDANHSPPRIVIVPKGARYAAAKVMGVQPGQGLVRNANPKVRRLRILEFEAHLWGQPDLTNQNTLQDFNDCLELERELLTAMFDNLTNVPGIEIMGGRFEQPQNMNRLGRLYLLNFAIHTPVADNSYVILPFANPGPSGVSVVTQVSAVFADGSSSIAGVITAPPK